MESAERAWGERRPKRRCCCYKERKAEAQVDVYHGYKHFPRLFGFGARRGGNRKNYTDGSRAAIAPAKWSSTMITSVSVDMPADTAAANYSCKGPQSYAYNASPYAPGRVTRMGRCGRYVQAC